MQTFLPYADFAKSFAVLDDKRLGNQVYREALTLARGKWKNHPAAKMWRCDLWWLCQYGLAGLAELANRGRIYPHIEKEFRLIMRNSTPKVGCKPWFIGNEDFHRSHRSNLLRKDPVWYGQFGWDIPDDLPYVWPDPERPWETSRHPIEVRWY